MSGEKGTFGERGALLMRSLRGRASVYTLIGEFDKGIGDYQRVIDFCTQGSVTDRNCESEALISIGYILVVGKSNYQKAKELVKRGLVIADKKRNPSTYAHGLSVSGDICCERGEYERSLHYYSEALLLYKRLKDQKKEGMCIGSIANVFGLRGDLKTSIKYFNKNLAMCREMGDKRGIGSVLCNIGTIYYDRGEFDTALEYFKRFYSITVEIGDKKGYGVACNNIGVIYHLKGESDGAVPYYEKYLTLSEEMGYRRGVGGITVNLAVLYISRGDLDTALQYCRKSVRILKELGSRKQYAAAVNNYGIIYLAKGDFQKALKYFRTRLKIAVELGEKKGMGDAYDNIGVVLTHLGKFKEAGEFLSSAEKTVKEIGDKRTLSQIYADYAMLYEAEENGIRAQKYAKTALSLSREVQSIPKEIIALRTLGVILLKEDTPRAISILQQSTQLADRERMGFEYAKSHFELTRAVLKKKRTESGIRKLREVRDFFERGGATYWAKKARRLEKQIIP
jgi:tetratricopeptide (TPR) repeat protein